MKEKDRKPIIVPNGYTFDGNLMGNPAAHLFGLPVYVEESTEADWEEEHF